MELPRFGGQFLVFVYWLDINCTVLYSFLHG